MLNDLSEHNEIISHDHYHSGEWCRASVSRRRSEQKLLKVIVDIDAYKAECDSIYVHSENPDEIELGLLVDQAKESILFDRESDEYYQD